MSKHGTVADYKERIRVFLAAVQAGASDASAAAEAGISRASIHRWHHGERPFDEAMRKQMQRARAIRERRWLNWIETAAEPTTNRRGQTIPGDWKAAQFLLSVTNREFAPVARAEVSGPGGAPVQVEQSVEHRLATPDPERMQKVMALLQQADVVQLLPTSGNGNGASTNGKNGEDGH